MASGWQGDAPGGDTWRVSDTHVEAIVVGSAKRIGRARRVDDLASARVTELGSLGIQGPNAWIEAKLHGNRFTTSTSTSQRADIVAGSGTLGSTCMRAFRLAEGRYRYPPRGATAAVYTPTTCRGLRVSACPRSAPISVWCARPFWTVRADRALRLGCGSCSRHGLAVRWRQWVSGPPRASRFTVWCARTSWVEQLTGHSLRTRVTLASWTRPAPATVGVGTTARFTLHRVACTDVAGRAADGAIRREGRELRLGFGDGAFGCPSHRARAGSRRGSLGSHAGQGPRRFRRDRARSFWRAGGELRVCKGHRLPERGTGSEPSRASGSPRMQPLVTPASFTGGRWSCRGTPSGVPTVRRLQEVMATERCRW